MFGHWNIAAVGEFDPAEFFGFVYEIEELSTGRSYIGKKFFRFKRQKTKANPSRTKDSDWQEYRSSCEPLREAIQECGEQNFEFRILSLCIGRCQLTYEEQQIQFSRDVLRARLPNGERKYWNRTIGHLLFTGVEKQTEEAKQKMSQSRMGKVQSAETRAKISLANTGRLHPELAERNREGQTPEAKEKIRQSWEGDDVRREATRQRAIDRNIQRTGMCATIGPDGKRTYAKKVALA